MPEGLCWQLSIITLLTLVTSGWNTKLSTKGRHFVLAFLENKFLVEFPIIQIYITSEYNTTVNVSVPRQWWEYPIQSLSVTPSNRTILTFPYDLHLQKNGRQDKGILVEATDDVTVQGVSLNNLSSEAFLAFPTAALGKEYSIVTYHFTQPSRHPQGPCELGVAAVEDNTEVEIWLPATEQQPRPLYLRMDAYEAYQFQGKGDLTGTFIKASKPVAVYSGALWMSVGKSPFMGDHLIEQLAPLLTWGTEFYTVPIATRKLGDIFRVLAHSNNTKVRVTGSRSHQLLTIDAGGYAEWESPPQTPLHLVANKAVMLMQYSQSYLADDVRDSDPFQLFLPPVKQYSNNFTFSTMDTFKQQGEFHYYINVVLPEGLPLEGLLLDGEPINITSHDLVHYWPAVAQTNYTALILHMHQGAHHLTHEAPDASLYASLYGLKFQEAIGHSLGHLLEVIDYPCTVSYMMISDKFDNDCDGRVDEEVENGEDDDRDGLVDEDLEGDPPNITWDEILSTYNYLTTAEEMPTTQELTTLEKLRYTTAGAQHFLKELMTKLMNASTVQENTRAQITTSVESTTHPHLSSRLSTGAPDNEEDLAGINDGTGTTLNIDSGLGSQRSGPQIGTTVNGAWDKMEINSSTTDPTSGSDSQMKVTNPNGLNGSHHGEGVKTGTTVSWAMPQSTDDIQTTSVNPNSQVVTTQNNHEGSTLSTVLQGASSEWPPGDGAGGGRGDQRQLTTDSSLLKGDRLTTPEADMMATTQEEDNFNGVLTTQTGHLTTVHVNSASLGGATSVDHQHGEFGQTTAVISDDNVSSVTDNLYVVNNSLIKGIDFDNSFSTSTMSHVTSDKFNNSNDDMVSVSVTTTVSLPVEGAVEEDSDQPFDWKVVAIPAILILGIPVLYILYITLKAVIGAAKSPKVAPQSGCKGKKRGRLRRGSVAPSSQGHHIKGTKPKVIALGPAISDFRPTTPPHRKKRLNFPLDSGYSSIPHSNSIHSSSSSGNVLDNRELVLGTLGNTPVVNNSLNNSSSSCEMVEPQASISLPDLIVSLPNGDPARVTSL